MPISMTSIYNANTQEVLQ